MQSREPDFVESGAVRVPDDMLTTVPIEGTGASVAIGGAVVALSDDPLLLEALSGAAGEGARVSSSPSSDRFVDQLVANAAGIALIDAACVVPSLRSFLIMLREQFPQLVLLLVGPAQVQSQVAAQIADGTVFRFVHKPASSQRLRLFLEAAARQQAGATAVDPPAPPLSVSPIGAGPPRGQRGPLIGAITLTLLAALAGGWVLMHGSSRTPSGEAAGPAPAATPPNSIDAPAPAPGPGSSMAGVPVESSLPAPAHDNPPHEGPARDAAAHDAALEAAQRTAQGARADQLAVYLQLARKRLASGALVEPPDDSARAYLDSAAALAPADPEVRATAVILGDALISQFRHAIAAGDTVRAQHWLAECNGYHISSVTLAQLTADLAQLQEAQSRPAATAAVIQGSDAPTVSPAASSGIEPAMTTTVAAADTPAPPASAASAPGAVASATDAVAPSVVSEAALQRVSFVTPVYPHDALERNISGWVDLEFTVTPAGKVVDVQVTAAEPRDTFERAARQAIESSRYRPVLRDGVAIAQRARIRVRFKP
jgi:TonB family protein